MKSLRITTDELRAELDRISKRVEDGPEGFTFSEFVKAFGMSYSSSLIRMRQMVSDGQVARVGRRRGVAISGTVKWVPVYQFVKTRKR